MQQIRFRLGPGISTRLIKYQPQRARALKQNAENWTEQKNARILAKDATDD